MIFIERPNRDTRGSAFFKNQYLLKAPSASGGFTLIEVLIGFSILSCILASVYSVFGAGMKIRDKSENLSKNYRDMNLAFDLISQDMGNILFYQRKEGESSVWSIDGTANTLTFYISTAEGLKEIKYSLQKKDYGSIHTTLIGQRRSKMSSFTLTQSKSAQPYALIREESNLNPLSDEPQPSEIDTLSSNLAEDGIRFLYAYRKKSENKELDLSWETTLPEGAVPIGVRVEMTPAKIKENSALPVFKKDFYFVSNLIIPDVESN